MCQNISKDSIHRSRIYRNSDSIIRIFRILDRCTPVVLVSGTVTYAIVAYLDVLRDSAVTRFAGLLVSAITRFPGLLVSVVTCFADLMVFVVNRYADLLVSAITRFANLTILLVSFVNRSIIIFSRLFVSLILRLPCLPYISYNLIIIQHKLILWAHK